MKRMAYAMSGTSQEKLLSELLLNGSRFGKVQGNGFVLQISINELAARSGIARETVSRELAKLKKLGILTSTKGKIVVPDRTLIARLLG